MLHPTLLTAFPGTAQQLLPDLQAHWKTRPGPLLAALEVSAHPEDLTAALIRLLAQDRQLQLRRQGHRTDSAVTLVWLADAHDPGVGAAVQKLRGLLQHAEWAGLEVRLHLLLFLPDVARPDPHGWEQARAQLLELREDPDATPVTRVWPLSLRNRADLYLRAAQDLLPLLAHFVELCVHSGDVLNPAVPSGRDWAGLGLARMQLRGAPISEIAGQLWQLLREEQLGPLPPLPPAPEALQAVVDSVPPGQGHHADPWAQAAMQALRPAREQLERQLSQLDSLLPWEYGREALLRGLPHLQEAHVRLRAAVKRSGEALDAAVAPFDDVAGVGGKRARLRRINARLNVGRSVDEHELDRLNDALAPVDDALGEHNAQAFLDMEREVAERRSRVQRWSDQLSELREELAALPEPPPAPPPGCVGGLLRLLRRVPPPPEPPQVLQRRTLERRVTALYADLQREHAQLTARRLRWDNQLMVYRLALAYHEAVRHESERADQALAHLQALTAETARTENDQPLVITATREQHIPPEALREEARALLRQGLGELFWDDDVDEARSRVRDAGLRLREEHRSPQLHDLDENLWATALLAAAPRVVSRSTPSQQLTFTLLGAVNPVPLASHYTAHDTWFPDETLLVQMLWPLHPDQLLILDGTSTPLAAVSSPSLDDVLPQEVTPMPSHDERHNPALDELFATL
ncbi:hypothetical protein [Deinococcus aerophilus]|uniref:Uncharacterized protein n=1 Tax=Deinococcus aerophilus TaxID=522488 RepID=A0ABQ2GX98_9DEIO|nr:hypothetical protein [Deinococcus aerophilus]GGM16640.1 hypothetical protein GCM10010841_26190 [Deinococcus aerophilus]